MKHVNMHEAKTQLSDLVQRVETTKEHVVLCRAGEPVARIIPFERPTDRLTPDPKLRVKLKYDPTEPLSEDEVPSGYR